VPWGCSRVLAHALTLRLVRVPCQSGARVPDGGRRPAAEGEPGRRKGCRNCLPAYGRVVTSLGTVGPLAQLVELLLSTSDDGET